MLEFIFITTAVFVDVLFPGPNFILVTSIARKFGKNRALSMLKGVLFGCFIWCVFLFFGSVKIFTEYPIVKIAIKLIGAFYILTLAIRMIKANLIKNKQDLSIQNLESLEKNEKKYFINGLFNCLLNPEVGLFYLIMFTRIIDVYGFNKLILGLYSFEFIFIQFICFYTIIAIFSNSKKIIGNYVKYLDIALSIILIVLCIRLFYNCYFDLFSYLFK